MKMSKMSIFQIFTIGIMVTMSIQIFGKDLNPFQGLMIKVLDGRNENQITEKFISFKTLKAFPQDSVLARGRSEDPERIWIGTPMKAVLESLNIDWQAIQKFSISAPDGYMSVLTGDMLKDLEHGLFVYQIQDMHQFPEQYGGMRVLFPNLHAMTWVNGPDQIIIQIEERESANNPYLIYPPNHKIFYHLTKFQSENPRLMLKDILASYGFSHENFYVLTRDSLYRAYQMNKVIQHMQISRDSDMRWAIDGVNVPTGLRTHDIVYLSSQHAGLLLKEFTNKEWQIWAHKVIPHHFGEKKNGSLVRVGYLSDGGKGPVSLESLVNLDHPEDLISVLKSVLNEHGKLEYISIQKAVAEVK